MPLVARIIESSDKRRDVRCPGLRSKQRLRYAETKRDIGANVVLPCKSTNNPESGDRERAFDDNVFRYDWQDAELR